VLYICNQKNILKCFQMSLMFSWIEINTQIESLFHQYNNDISIVILCGDFNEDCNSLGPDLSFVHRFYSLYLLIDFFPNKQIANDEWRISPGVSSLKLKWANSADVEYFGENFTFVGWKNEYTEIFDYILFCGEEIKYVHGIHCLFACLFHCFVNLLLL
jgi:hypothetical protein